MKTQVLLITILMITMLLFIGCEKNNNTPDKSWEVAYKEFLKELYIDSFENKDSDIYKNENYYLYEDDPYEIIQFALKDLDNNGIPELIITKYGPNLTVYSYKEKVVEVGAAEFGTGTTRLLFSGNPSYSGIFSFLVGGGYEHYGYLSFSDNKLHNEELWNDDYSGISKELDKKRNKIEELSDDKLLIEESKVVYENNNDLLFHNLHPDNFSKGLTITSAAL